MQTVMNELLLVKLLSLLQLLHMKVTGKTNRWGLSQTLSSATEFSNFA